MTNTTMLQNESKCGVEEYSNVSDLCSYMHYGLALLVPFICHSNYIFDLLQQFGAGEVQNSEAKIDEVIATLMRNMPPPPKIAGHKRKRNEVSGSVGMFSELLDADYRCLCLNLDHYLSLPR